MALIHHLVALSPDMKIGGNYCLSNLDSCITVLGGNMQNFTLSFAEFLKNLFKLMIHLDRNPSNLNLSVAEEKSGLMRDVKVTEVSSFVFEFLHPISAKRVIKTFFQPKYRYT